MKFQNQNFFVAVRRKRGELNISVNELARQTGVSRWTLDKILKGRTNSLRPSTIRKINEWLYKHV
ncbi:helix-turn-helix transcriptional regulator [Pediococcus stilesii]|uniref:Helix-turn-helix transcriptional regulator n=1 Tax=Pediococcus stilesii TaxID=331679 RepID=A0A5R9BT44_9LACO|nr:helix-turn-helix transcriptional regulator [Pediococcus stilesii]TLQ03785.1 helix-turn-helix transcriptional regulator [Pediococcus stilesii]